jgi:hypothetical protein
MKTLLITFIAERRSEREPGYLFPARIFTPGERNTPAKSSNIAGAWFMDVWVIITLISKYGCFPGMKKEKI